MHDRIHATPSSGPQRAPEGPAAGATALQRSLRGATYEQGAAALAPVQMILGDGASLNVGAKPKVDNSIGGIAASILARAMGKIWLVPDRISYGEAGGHKLLNAGKYVAMLGPRALGSFVLATNRYQTSMKDPANPTQEELTKIAHYAMANMTGNCYELAAIAFVLAKSEYGVPNAMIVQMGADHTVTFISKTPPPDGKPSDWSQAYKASTYFVDPWLKKSGPLTQLGGHLAAASVVTNA